MYVRVPCGTMISEKLDDILYDDFDDEEEEEGTKIEGEASDSSGTSDESSGSSSSEDESVADSDSDNNEDDESGLDIDGDELEAVGYTKKSETRSIKISEMMRSQISSASAAAIRGQRSKGKPREAEQEVDIRPIVMDIDIPDVPVLIAEGGIPGLGNKAFSGSQTKRSRSLVIFALSLSVYVAYSVCYS